MDQEEIVDLRKKLDLTQDDFAIKLGVSRMTVNRWETGKSTLNFQMEKEIKNLLPKNVTSENPDVTKSQENVTNVTIPTKTGTAEKSNVTNSKEDVTSEDANFVTRYIQGEGELPESVRVAAAELYSRRRALKDDNLNEIQPLELLRKQRAVVDAIKKEELKRGGLKNYHGFVTPVIPGGRSDPRADEK